MKDGALWVKDGAVLPDICLDGSSATRRSGPVKLSLTTRLFQSAMITGTLIGTAILATLASIGSLGLLGFSQIMIALVIAASIGPAAIAAWKGERKSVTIHRSTGLRSMGKGIIRLLICAAVYYLAIIALDHASRILALAQRQQIGLSYTLMFVFVMTLGLVLRPGSIRAVAVEGGWFLLQGVHPSAITGLARIQTAAADDSSA